MKTIKEAQSSILADIPKENWPIAGDIQQKLFQAWDADIAKSELLERIEKIRKEAVIKHKEVIYKTYKFQVENGYLAEGTFEIYIRDHLAKVIAHKITSSARLLIEAHGGEILVEEKRLKPRKRQTKEVTDDDSTST